MITLNLYIHLLSCLDALKEGILKIPGIKHSINGYNKDNTSENNISFIK